MSVRKSLAAGLVCAALTLAAQNVAPEPASILKYIVETWTVLTRSIRNLAAAAPDPKFPAPPGGWLVYVSRTEDLHEIQRKLSAAMSPEDFRRLRILPLPIDAAAAQPPGLLYLPLPYVVPGGRFNEMYGWDSYFIATGLLRDGKIALARDMSDNFLYEIRQYGKILNANRTYYLTRSQPPFLTEMLLDVYRRTHDRQWLADAVPAIEKYYAYWTTGPHLTAETGLSRYWDAGDRPAPEVIASERDPQGRTHYDLVKQYFRTHHIADYDVREYYDAAKDELTPQFYRGDRSMRESGFDPSDRFGPFSIDIIHYDPVCLNSLLYLMESQTAEILRTAGRPQDAARWTERARARQSKINSLLWDSRDGLYYDYDFATGNLRRYPFLTTFYPLWAGIATREQAARVEANLKRFERPGGLETSTVESGNQWDAPFGWAPLERIAVDGLRRYGYDADAERISREFLSMVLEDFEHHGTIVEKYDVVHRTSNLANGIHYGYRSNEAGFGWTNAVFTRLFDELTPQDRKSLR